MAAAAGGSGGSGGGLHELGLAEGLARLRAGSLTARAWAGALVARMEAARSLNLFITETGEQALAEAERADEAYAAGTARPLEGAPLAVKDIFCTEGVRTTAGSKILEGFVPPYEATVVARLRAAGAVVLGKTNLDEFAMGSSNENSAFGAALSPWRDGEGRRVVPGGSSGGSAGAVAARLAPAALGTDTGGSVRQPAAFCGVAGFKPTYGRMSRFGVIAYASSLDQPGLFARTAGDFAPLFAAAAGRDPLDSTSADRPVPELAGDAGSAGVAGGDGLAGLRVGLPREYRIEGLHLEVSAAWEESAEKLRGLGAEVAEVSLPHTAHALAAYYIIAPAEASANLARYDGLRYGLRAPGQHDGLDAMYEATRALGFGAEVKRRILVGAHVLSAGYYDAYYNHARKVRALVAQDFARAFEKCDLMLFPAAPSPAFAPGAGEGAGGRGDPTWMYQQDVFTVPVSLAGLPAVSLPVGLAKSGLPLGLQLAAPAFEEARLLAASVAFERAVGFAAAPDDSDWAGGTGL